ncbi:MAG: HPF/RaiA family ribosome-associated protein [Muribaculaceae bacterium]
MDVKIKAIHFDVSEKLVTFINKKVEKICRNIEGSVDVEVTLKVVKPETTMNKDAGIKFISPAYGDLFASKTADTFEEAIDISLEAIEKQIEKQKEKAKK